MGSLCSLVATLFYQVVLWAFYALGKHCWLVYLVSPFSFTVGFVKEYDKEDYQSTPVFCCSRLPQLIKVMTQARSHIPPCYFDLRQQLITSLKPILDEVCVMILANFRHTFLQSISAHPHNCSSFMNNDKKGLRHNVDFIPSQTWQLISYWNHFP